MNYEYILSELSKGIVCTLELTALVFIGGFLFGFILSVGRTYGSRFIRWLSIGYIELIRGTPMLLQILIIGFGLPIAIRNYYPDFTINSFWAVSIAMILNSGAYQAEYFRGAFNSLEFGQTEAALALGMSKWEIVKNILLPQAIRRAFPNFTNELIYILKYSSLAMILSVHEMTYQAKSVGAVTFRYGEIYLLLGALYLAFAFALAQIMKVVEMKIYIPGVTTRVEKRGLL